MQLTIGQAITLEDPERPEAAYQSRIADYDESSLWIELPLDVREGRIIHHWPRGRTLNVFFVDALGVAYRFRTTVFGTERRGIPLVRLYRPDPEAIERTQRRSHLRVPALLPLAVVDLSGRRFVLRTHDISAGGLSFIVPKGMRLLRGDALKLYVALAFRNGDTRQVIAAGEVVRLWNDDAKPEVLFASVKFTELTPSDEQLLVRFAFDRQLQLKEKGLM
ncbi:MAG: PilZ domain-containing protein [Hydrogenibacillus sp.]|nr:PilZ domain-containing protein [Hydrogenibacillus sp.]